MSRSRPIQILIFTVSLALGSALALPASAEPAKETKQKKQVVTPAPARVKPGYWGQDKFPAGPIYEGNLYLGDDPDPFIRSQIYRDLAAKHGGID
jgi:hypothetical protein